MVLFLLCFFELLVYIVLGLLESESLGDKLFLEAVLVLSKLQELFLQLLVFHEEVTVLIADLFQEEFSFLGDNFDKNLMDPFLHVQAGGLVMQHGR